MIDRPKAQFLNRQTQPHMVTLIMMVSISALAMNIFLPSLPRMAEEFGTSAAILGLSVSVYLAVSALVQLFSGPLSDMQGRRQVTLWSIVLFTAVSIAITFCQNTGSFLILRAIQSVIASVFVISRAIVRDTTDTANSGSRIAYIMMGMALVPMFGPALGGVIDAYFGWRANFWILSLLGVALWLNCFFDLGETAPTADVKFRAHFALYPDLLRSKRFWGYCFTSALGSGAFFAYLGGAPFVGSEIFSLSPEALGLFFGAPAAGYFLGNFFSGRFSSKIGLDAMIFWGLALNLFGLTASLAVFYNGMGSAISFFGFMTFVGFGNGLSIPNATAGMLAIRPDLAGAASGLGSAIMIAGGAALSALAGAVLTPTSGATPLLWLMWSSVAAGVICMIYVKKRHRSIQAS
jgi:DHA1 family bicyclomycin/chloramphenicol resistance-like MFS transporter